MVSQESAIYLDYNATTPLHPRVRDGMLEVLDGGPGNPSSMHAFGRRARKIVEEAREKLAAFLRVSAAEIYFTSGGTESNNLAVHGLVPRSAGIFVGAGEHASILQPAKRSWKAGSAGGTLPLESDGRVQREALAAREFPPHSLVSIQWVNNETGAIQDLEHWTSETHRRGGVFHTDGAQGFFRLPEAILKLGVDAATITAHKSMGPAGAGALFLKKGIVVDPRLAGGPQERQVRPGTENVAAIHGMGILAELASAGPLWDCAALREKNRLLRERILEIPGSCMNAPAEVCFPNTLNVSFPGLLAETILVRLDMAGVALSSGSACASGAREPSHVLKAMGLSDEVIRGAIRISFGPQTTWDELQAACGRLESAIRDLRRTRP